MRFPNQGEKIKEALEEYMNNHAKGRNKVDYLKIKNEMYTHVVNKLDVPRPSVRRVASAIKKAYKIRVELLESQ